VKKNVRPWIIANGIIPLALTLTGCFGGPSLPNLPGSDDGSDQVDETVEDIVEGSNDDVDYEGDALPADFPVDDIPLVPGDPGPSMSISGGTAWTVTIFTADEATANTAPDLLEAAGFSHDSGIFWETEEYLVIITGITETESDGWAVSYQVQVQP
jgi:hypothetical protein